MDYVQARKYTTDNRIAEDKDTRRYGLPKGSAK